MWVSVPDVQAVGVEVSSVNGRIVITQDPSFGDAVVSAEARLTSTERAERFSIERYGRIIEKFDAGVQSLIHYSEDLTKTLSLFSEVFFVLRRGLEETVSKSCFTLDLLLDELVSFRHDSWRKIFSLPPEGRGPGKWLSEEWKGNEKEAPHGVSFGERMRELSLVSISAVAFKTMTMPGSSSPFGTYRVMV